jgi:hypothetical protein
MSAKMKFLKSIVNFDGLFRKKKSSVADCQLFLEFKQLDENEHAFFGDKSPVKITLLGRTVYKTTKQKHLAWFIESPTGYLTLEYTIIGILIKYYSKSRREIKDAYLGMLGFSDNIYFNRNFSTHLNFNQVLCTALDLKSSFNKTNYDYGKNDCRDFVISLGQKLDASFDMSRDECSLLFKEKVSYAKSQGHHGHFPLVQFLLLQELINIQTV